MTRLRVLALTSLLATAALMPACATTSTTTTTWTDPQAGGAGWWRPGRVESVQEVVQRTQGDPAGGAVAGAVIGGLLFGGNDAASTLIGAAGGAIVGAAASQGSEESRTYQVLVHFDDGAYATFAYNGYTPFRPGERVVLTPQGLARG